MTEDKFEKTKDTVLTHIQNLFEELEQEMAVSHQEKYALLEDSFENASDEDELRVAFEQWFTEHVDELNLDYGDADELWAEAVGEDTIDSHKDDDDDLIKGAMLEDEDKDEAY
jgi:hypothetical protein